MQRCCAGLRVRLQPPVGTETQSVSCPAVEAALHVGGGRSRPAGQGLKSRDQLGWSVAKASHTIGPVQTDAMILGAFEGSSMTLQDHHTSY